MSTLSARSVSRIYGTETVVDRVSLELKEGEITALLGGSGVGKSTLLRLVAGLEPVNDGEIIFDGETLSSKTRTVATEDRRIGLIFQDFALFPHLTALENVCFGLPERQKQDRVARAADWLARLDLSDRADAYPHQLSGGEQQRVSIARALAPEPVAILMDEPFSGLDPALREVVRERSLDAVRESGVPALLVTHDAREAMISADVLAVMREGRIVQTGSPETIYTAPVDLQTARALGPVNTLIGLGTPDGAYETPFGPLPYDGNASSIQVAVREEHVRIATTRSPNAVVTSSTRIGPMVRLVVEANGTSIAALVAPENRQDVGTKVNASFDNNEVFIFDAGMP